MPSKGISAVYAVWKLALIGLLLANVSFLIHNFVGWIITLGFFLLVPGYLLLQRFEHRFESRWETLSFSLGLSILFLMIGGLLINLLYYVGLTAPLSTPYIFLFFDLFILILIWANRKKFIQFSGFHLKRGNGWWIIPLLSLLPLLATAGAIRLNNGASNILTMIMFGMIAACFVLLVCKKEMQKFYPYALVMFALAILLSVSLRGWDITGHDIQREFHVFISTAVNGFWDIASFRDPYNACLSITILPTILAKITGIAEPYIFKVVFQIIFAVCLVPIYFFVKKIAPARLAFMSAFLFISFPTFLNDMSMLNRQEISFLFFSLLMLLVFTNIKRPDKKIMTILLLVGTIISHYSSSYITLGTLIIAWLIFLLLKKIYRLKSSPHDQYVFPTLNITIIIVALLTAFLWNSQITATTKGLNATLGNTFQGLLEKKASKSQDVGYSVLGGKVHDPQEVLNSFAKQSIGRDITVHYVEEPNLPLTSIGHTLSQYVDVESFNTTVRNISARFIQVMLVIGCIALIIMQRKKMNQQKIYFLALTATGILLLALQTVLPQLSVDYGILRLFQQELIVLGLPSIVGVLLLFHWAKKYKFIITASIFAVLFLHLSGFIPQLVGGYKPQLALNNAGSYYNAYYINEGERMSASWLMKTNTTNTPVAMDLYSQLRFNSQERARLIILHPFTPVRRAYEYRSRFNTQTDAYIANINSNLYNYKMDRPRIREDILYTNDFSSVRKITNE